MEPISPERCQKKPRAVRGFPHFFMVPPGDAASPFFPTAPAVPAPCVLGSLEEGIEFWRGKMVRACEVFNSEPNTAAEAAWRLSINGRRPKCLKRSLGHRCLTGPMKAIVAASVFCIVFSVADRALFAGRLVESVPVFAKAIAKGFFG